MSASEATHHRRSATGGGGASVSDDSDDDQSWHSMSESGNVHRKSCESDCPAEEVDLERGVLELKKVLHLSKVERNCRICHLGLEGGGGTGSGSGVPIDLGCSCKGDLGAAHKQCAETWFKIKGDTEVKLYKLPRTWREPDAPRLKRLMFLFVKENTPTSYPFLGDVLVCERKHPNIIQLISHLTPPEYPVQFHHLLTNYPRFSVCFLVLLVSGVASEFSLGRDTSNVQLMAVLVAFMMFESLEFIFYLWVAYLNHRR